MINEDMEWFRPTEQRSTATFKELIKDTVKIKRPTFVYENFVNFMIENGLNPDTNTEEYNDFY